MTSSCTSSLHCSWRSINYLTMVVGMRLSSVISPMQYLHIKWLFCSELVLTSEQLAVNFAVVWMSYAELRESLSRVGSDLKQRIIDSVKSTWNALNSLARYRRDAGDDGSVSASDIDTIVSETVSTLDDTNNCESSPTNCWIQTLDSANRWVKVYAQRFAESESKTSLHFLD